MRSPLPLRQIEVLWEPTLFEKTPILRALQACDSQNDWLDPGNQLILSSFQRDGRETTQFGPLISAHR